MRRRRLAFLPVRASIAASSGQPPVFGELHGAIADALAAAGVPCDVSIDCLAAGADDLVHVLVPAAYLPHVHPAAYPSPEQLRRTVLVVTEAPGEPGFDEARSLAESAAAVLALDADAARELKATPFKPGYVAAWDAWGGAERERDIDLVMLGEFSDRRSLAVAEAAAALQGRHAAIHLERRPLTPASAAATPSGAAKWELLARARVLLCVHDGESRGFDWQAAGGAIANGCVVLTEQAEGHGPLVAGRHFECAGFHALPTALEGLLGSPDRLGRVRRGAYATLRDELPPAALGATLRGAVETAAAAPAPRGHRSRLALPMPVPAPAPEPAVERLQRGQDEDAMVRAALKQSLLRLRRLERKPGSGEDRIVEVGPQRAPRVSVVITLYNYADTIAAALRSVALSDMDEVEVVLVEDASTDDSLAVAHATLAELPWLSGRVVERGANGGLARARNLGIEHARGDLVFVLDADNEVHESGLRVLAAALDESPDADFAYGLIRAIGPSGPMGLLSWAPWDPWWLRIDNYIDAMAMLRRASVQAAGGYTTAESLYGWEDFELWCNMASRGMSGKLVPEVVATYRAGRQSMISLTTLDTTDGWTTLLDRYEFLREAA